MNREGKEEEEKEEERHRGDETQFTVPQSARTTTIPIHLCIPMHTIQMKYNE